jgi:hypothetical protein
MEHQNQLVCSLWVSPAKCRVPDAASSSQVEGQAHKTLHLHRAWRCVRGRGARCSLQLITHRITHQRNKRGVKTVTFRTLQAPALPTPHADTEGKDL